jgi:hypothetical protein
MSYWTHQRHSIPADDDPGRTLKRHEGMPMIGDFYLVRRLDCEVECEVLIAAACSKLLTTFLCMPN